jgi:SNF2 family DNA or RNA helicase
MQALGDTIAQERFSVIVFDEVATFRNTKTKLFKGAARAAATASFVWGLTGTPMPRAPTDAFGIIKLVTPSNPHLKSFTMFRDELMVRNGPFKWLERKNAKEKVYEWMQPAVRFRLDECVDIPPTTYTDLEVPLTPRQKKAYDALRKYATLLTEGDGQTTAANEAVLRSKLCQVSSGAVYTHDGQVVWLDPTERLTVMANTLIENGRKALVFVPFKSLLTPLSDYLTKVGIKHSCVHGGTPQGERTRIFSEFQDGPEGLEVILAHPKTMSHGLTLTAANMILWYAPIDDLEIYNQACARIPRPGQTLKTAIVHLVGSPAERKMYRNLGGKDKRQVKFLELFD